MTASRQAKRIGTRQAPVSVLRTFTQAQLCLRRFPMKNDIHESSVSRTIQDLTIGLSQAQIPTVNNLVAKLPKLFENYRARYVDLGSALHELQVVFATAGKTGRFTRALKQLGIPRSTAYDAIKFVNMVRELPEAVLAEAEERKLDVSEPRIVKRIQAKSPSHDISKENAKQILDEVTAPRKTPPKLRPKRFKSEADKQFFRLCKSLHTIIGDIPIDERVTQLNKALNLIAHELELPSFNVTPTPPDDQSDRLSEAA